MRYNFGIIAFFLTAIFLCSSVTEAWASPTVSDRLETLESENQQLKDRVDELEQGQAATDTQSARHKWLRLSGYMDLGFYWPGGDGVGFITDTTGIFAADFPGVPNILIGDPWSTPVNSRGDPADTDGSFTFINDPVNSNGKPSVIANELNLELVALIHPTLSVVASLDFTPRRGNGGQIGDFFELDLAHLDWSPFEARHVTFYFGKYDSAFGREYRFQESPDRTGISPSLIFRYVGGHPLGAKVRARLFDGDFIINFAVNTGSSHIESFPFSEELDSNSVPALSGRVSYAWEMGPVHVDLGASGEWGAQSGQPDNGIFQWQFGGDVKVSWRDLVFIGEYVKGKAPGGGSANAEFLKFQGAYTEFSYQVLNWLTPYGRWGFRKATHLGRNFVYITDIMRLTYGVRFDVTHRIILKAEYLQNIERGRSPNFANDLFLTSFVFTF